tara:strand:- start:306 stop:629 length:324 start_codon:yes stop_codon:yes gene_type:complete
MSTMTEEVDNLKKWLEESKRTLLNYKQRLVEAEEALANALAGDHRVADSDKIIMEKMERIQDLENINEEHRKLNGKLQQRLTEVEEDNKKLANQIEDKINQLRRSGM